MQSWFACGRVLIINPRYIVETTKSPAQAVTDLEASVKQHGYGVLYTYDLKQTLASKGFDLPNACHILEVCNPKQAAAVLAADMGMSIALPCRIEFSIDGGEFRPRETFTHWSTGLHLPWALILDDQLKPGRHTAKVRIAADHDPKGTGTVLRVFHLLLN